MAGALLVLAACVLAITYVVPLASACELQIAAGTETRDLGVEHMELRRIGTILTLDLLSSDGDLRGTIVKHCDVGPEDDRPWVVLAAGGSRLELRGLADRGWVLDGAPLTRAEGGLAALFASSDPRYDELRMLLEVIDAEPQVDPFSAATGSLLGCGPDDPMAGVRDRRQRLQPARETYSCGKRGQWQCLLVWSAGTSDRRMAGTELECGLLHCGDTSHTQPETWVDIVGGISESCEDHSTSFWGPVNGEWDGCTEAAQQSTGYQAIEGVNQTAEWWRPQGAGHVDVWDDGWCYDPWTGPDPPPYVWFAGGSTIDLPNSGAFASVYDLDYCISKQLAGTIYWPDFVVTAEVVTDDPEHKVTYFGGQAPLACAEGWGCENDLLCADLIVQGVQTCTWYWDEPRTRCDLDC